MKNRRTTNQTWTLLTVIQLSLLALAILIPGHLGGWLLERLFTLAAAAICLATWCYIQITRQQGPATVKTTPFVILFLSVSIVYATATLLSSLVETEPISRRELAELIRFPIYCLFFLVFWSRISDRLLKWLDYLNLSVLLYAHLVFITYLYKLPGLYPFFAGFLYADTKTSMSQYVGGYFRFSVPFENPNFLGFFIILCLVYYLFFAPTRNAFKIVIVLLIIPLIITTGSRSCWLATIFTGIFYYIYVLIMLFTRFGIKQFLATATTGLIIGILFMTNFQAIYEVTRLGKTLEVVQDRDLLRDDSVSGRVQNIQNAMFYFQQHRMIGIGGSKNADTEIIDNQFVSILVRNGLLGFLAIHGLFLYLIIRQLNQRCKLIYKFGIASLITVLFVFLNTGAFLYNFRLFICFIFIYSAMDFMINRDFNKFGPRRRLVSVQSVSRPAVL